MAAYLQITSYLEKSAPLRQVTEKGLQALKQRSLRRSEHRGIQANNQLPEMSAQSQTSHR